MPRSVASVSILFRRATTTRKKRTGSYFLSCSQVVFGTQCARTNGIAMDSQVKEEDGVKDAPPHMGGGSASAGSFLGTAQQRTQAAREALVSPRKAGSRSVVSSRADPAETGHRLLADRGVRRVMWGLHTQALKELVPVAAVSVGATPALTKFLLEACTSSRKFRDEVSRASAVALQPKGQAVDGDQPELSLEVADELRTLHLQHGELWPALLAQLQQRASTGTTLGTTQGVKNRTLQDWHRILCVCEDSTIATALAASPPNESVQVFLHRIGYDQQSLDPECTWFAKMCLLHETTDAQAADSVQKALAKEARAAYKALGAAQQRVNALHRDLDGARVVSVLVPPVGPMELVLPGSGHRVNPTETVLSEVSTPFCALAYMRASA